MVKLILSIISLSVVAHADIQKLELNPKQSQINWKADKEIGSFHTGTVALKSGEVVFNKDQLSGGTIVIDMNSIAVTDIPVSDANNKKLVGHLVSDDFFNVKKNQEAKLVIKNTKQISPNKLEVVGDLTIKDVTKPVKFPVEYSRNGKSYSAKGKIVVDRTQFGIKYGSKNFFKLAADRIIKNEFELDFAVATNQKVRTPEGKGLSPCFRELQTGCLTHLLSNFSIV